MQLDIQSYVKKSIIPINRCFILKILEHKVRYQSLCRSSNYGPGSSNSCNKCLMMQIGNYTLMKLPPCSQVF